jgi:rhodanese-related sulfurtransferase
MSIFSATTPAAVRRALLAKTEIALLDVRQESRFATGHPLFAASFPLGHLEAQAGDRLPRRAVPIVVYGDGGDDALAAARRLRELGYTDVSLLAGGLAGWTADGGELFEDVNAPSKAFGELVAETAGTPSLAADEVAALLRPAGGVAGGAGVGAGPTAASVVVVDARRFDEYATMSIPTATSVPGAELALRVRALAPDPATTVVVNCAGRTRSIIGTQSLINAGLPNRIVALRNGTIGWTLAGLELDHGQTRRAPQVSRESARQAAAAAWAVADRACVRRIGGALGEQAEPDDGHRTVYRFDVRTREEYDRGHRPGFRSAPGGQLVQETDWYAPVRGARIALAEDGIGRAAMTGSWLAQMGWDVTVVAPAAGEADDQVCGDTGDRADGAVRVAPGAWPAARPPAPDGPHTVPSVLAGWLRAGQAAVIDLETSKRFAARHIPGAAWALRADLSDPALAGRLGWPQRIVLTSADGYLAAWAAADLAVAGPPRSPGVAAGTGASTRPFEVFFLAGGTLGWAQSGRPVESGGGQLLSPAVDVYRRPYEGTGVDPAVMQAYLDWEYGLVAQLERDATHRFRVIKP